MPISRYEVRNEYSLADPELYRAADKDDPEALLEGVAMAGLVGVLRQLGDLAEFAAEIFHNLHEEVMVTAARGHGLMVRVQQLESEIPYIERAFLSQTDHSSFFYHAGVDWHPNLRLDQNLITQGDLPRFIMDSYEECRAPPRLFLLDKFDVAGAGACLKRYTDPSFFKVENSDIIGADVQREKKIRKIKKKGPRLRNGETTEVLQTTHSKLHQLFLEERVENGVSKPSFRAKLKRKLNGFPFDSKTEKSYMEKILKSPSPDHKVLHDVTMNSPHLMTATDHHKESSYQVYEVRPVSPDGASWERKRSPPSPDGEENMLNPFMRETTKSPVDDNHSELPNSYPGITTNGISSSLSATTGEKVVAVDVEGDREESYQSDDIASEIDNFVDAPSNMDLEMDGDSGLRVKGDVTSSHIEHESLILDADEEHLHTRSSDSPGGSTMSDEGNTSSTKELSSFSSNSPSTSLENPQSENTAAKGFQYDDVPLSEMADASYHQKTADEDFHVDHQSKPVVSDDTRSGTDEITNHRSQFELLNSSLYSNGLLPDLTHSDSEEVGTKGMLKVPESDETITMDDEEKKANLAIDPPCSPSLCGESQSENESPGSSAREHLVEEQNGESLPCPSTVPDINLHTADSSGETPLDSLHADEFDGKDQDLVDDVASKLKTLDVLWTSDTPETISSRYLIPGAEDEFPEVPENSPSDYPLTAHNGDNIEPALSKQDKLIYVLDDEDSNGSTDSPVPCITEASLDKKLDEAYLATAQTVNVEDCQSYSSINNQIGSENSKFSNLAISPDSQTKGLDAHEVNVVPEEVTTTNETLAIETPEHCDVVGSLGTTHDVFLNNSEALGNSCCTSEDLEEPAGTADTVESNEISLFLCSTGQEVTEIPGSADLKPVSGVDELLNKFDSEADKSNTTNTASAMPADSDNASLNNLVEEQINSFEDSGKDELEDNENCPSECRGESDDVEKVDQTEASASGSETVFSNAVNNDESESDVSGTIPNSHLVLVADHSPEFVHAATIELPVEEYGVDREQDLFNQSYLENHAHDGLSLPVDKNTENTVAQEKNGLAVDQADQDFLHPGEISSELPPSLPINHQQMLDHDDCKQDNNLPSFSELPRPSNCEIDVPGYPKDSFSSIFPPINPFSETNHKNPSDLPPLPPLPPVEWRMGKFQLSSSSTDGEMTRHKDFFPELISPQTLPSDHTSSPPPPTATDPPPVASINEINPSHEQIKHSSIVNSPETASKEESSCSSLEANTSHETTSLPAKIENKQEQHVMPISGSVSTSPAIENVENSCSTLEAITLHDTKHLPPKIENKQEQSVMPISESVSTSPAKEDGSRTVKLPWPRNSLIDDVAILDKSKLRKVTERVRPEIQKVDERDSLLEQIRTKSFNLKPAMASRPSIRGPNTNLNVAAILEKANAIRQAFAGSDEDDNDSWSE